MNKEEALKLLNEEGSLAPDNRWISHSICVGDTASVIAEKLNLDKEKARVLGYIHDIGKRFGSFPLHDLNGFNYIKELGYSDEYANICLTHSYLNNDYLCTAGSLPEDIPFRTQFIKNHEYTIYEKIINLCDLMCTNVVNTVDKRLIDIKNFEIDRIDDQRIYFIKKYSCLKSQNELKQDYENYIKSR